MLGKLSGSIPQGGRVLNLKEYLYSISNNIKFSSLMANMTKCWNLDVATFNNNKYKSLTKFHHVFLLTYGKTDTKLVSNGFAGFAIVKH